MKEEPKRRMTPAAIVAMVQGNEANFMAATTPGGIEAQEKEGQISMCASDHLPVKMTPQTLLALNAAGFVLGEPIPNDPIFMHATFPPGWRKVSTDHAMWSDIVDAKGRKRFDIFYKAAFYDRHADLMARCRYVVSQSYCDATGTETRGKHTHIAFRVIDNDSGTALHVVGPIEDVANGWDALAQKEREAHAWLDAKFPDRKNPAAYWD